MSYVTTHLDEESGIQYQGVQDKTDIRQIGDLSNMLLLVEDLPRGRLDQAMTITKANNRPLLGSQKGNLYLQTIEDALDSGVPSIQVLRILSNSQEGGEIDYTGEYPISNGVIAFRVKNINDKISIKVNEKNIVGSMYEIMDKLAEEYQVYMSYLAPNILLITNSGLGFKNIVVRGVQSYIADKSELDDVSWLDIKDDYCPAIKVDEQTYAFSLKETRVGFLCLFDVGAKLNDLIALDYANKATDVVNNNLLVNQVKLTRWYIDSEEIFLNSIVPFTNRPQVAFSEIFANPTANGDYEYYYNRVVNFSFAKALAKYSDNLADNNIYYNSNSGLFFSESTYYLDVGIHLNTGKFIKGYPAYLSLPM